VQKKRPLGIEDEGNALVWMVTALSLTQGDAGHRVEHPLELENVEQLEQGLLLLLGETMQPPAAAAAGAGGLCVVASAPLCALEVIGLILKEAGDHSHSVRHPQPLRVVAHARRRKRELARHDR
jgi:hypothetical protein